MSVDLHKMNVEIRANIEHLKKGCEEAKTEVKNAQKQMNDEMKKVGAKDFSGNVGRQMKDIRDQAKNTVRHFRELSREAQENAGNLIPSKGYQELRREVKKSETEISKLIQRQKDIPADKARDMTKSYESTTNKVKQLEGRLDSLIAKQEAWVALGGKVTSSGPFKKLEAEIESEHKKLQEMYASLGDMEKKGTAFTPSKRWQNLQEQIDRTKNKVREYKKEQAGMEAAGTAFSRAKGVRGIDIAKTNLGAAKKQLQGYIRELGKSHPRIARINQALSRMGKIGNAVGTGLRKTWAGTSTAIVKSTKAVSKFIAKLRELRRASAGASGGMYRMGKGSNMLSRAFSTVARRAKFMIAAFVVVGAVKGLQDGFRNLSQYSNQTNADLSALMGSLIRLKNALAAAFAPILTHITPALNAFILKIGDALNMLGKFFGALTGKKQVAVAKRVQTDYAAGLKGIESAADKAGKSTKKAKDRAEEYKRSLMGFDQINKLEEPTKDLGADDPDDSTPKNPAAAAGGLGPSDMFETVDVGSKAKKWADAIKKAWANADFTSIGIALGNKLNSALESIPWDKIKHTSAKIGKSIATFLNGFIAATKWELVGKTLAEGFNTAIEFLYAFVTNFKWAKLGNAIADTINGFFKNVDFAKYGKTVSKGVIGVLTTVITALKNTDWKMIGNKFVEYIANIDWLKIAGLIVRGLSAAAKGILRFIQGVLEGISKHLSNYIKSGNLGKDLLDLVKTIFTEIWGLIKEFLKTIWDLATTIGDVLIALSVAIWEGIKKPFVAVGEWFGNTFKKAVKGIFDAFSDIGSWASERWENIKSGFSATAKWFGQTFSSGYSAIKGAFKSAGTWASERWRTMSDKFKNAPSWFGGKFRSAYSSLTGAFANVGSFFSGLWNNRIKPHFTNIGARVGNAVGGAFRAAMNAVIRTVENAINSGINFINGALKLIDKMLPGDQSGRIKKVSLPRFARGGFPEEGPFYMNRGEIAGKFSDGRTVVANNQQITDGIAAAVYKAFRNATVGQSNGPSADAFERGVQTIVAALGQISFRIGDEELAKTVNRGQAKINRRFNPVG